MMKSAVVLLQFSFDIATMALSQDDFMRLQEELINMKSDFYDVKAKLKKATDGTPRQWLLFTK